MSFASQAREEIAQRSLQLQKDCCVRAAAYGIACFAKYFDAKGLVVQTEQQETVQAAQQLFARCGVQDVPLPGRGGCRRPAAGGKRGQDTKVSCPLLRLPNFPLSRDSLRSRV